MSLKHISDEELQAHIENKDSTVEEHLRLCEECRHTYRHYVMLQRKLKQLPEPTLSADFSVNIMSTLKAEAKEAEESAWSLIGMSIVLSVITLVGTVFIIGWQKSLAWSNELLSSFSITELAAYKSFLNFFQTHSSVWGIILFAGMTILFFSLLEKLYTKVKQTRISIFSI